MENNEFENGGNILEKIKFFLLNLELELKNRNIFANFINGLKNNKIKIGIALILIILFAFIIILVGGKSPVSKQEILNAVISYRDLYDMDVKEYKIEKRYTNKDTRTDQVWFYIEAENDIVRFCENYQLTYTLYNDGWELNGISILDSERIALENVEESQVQSDMIEYYSSFISEFALTDVTVSVQSISKDSNNFNTVNCTLNGKNEALCLSQSIKIEAVYECWKSGWALESIRELDYPYQPLSNPSKELLSQTTSQWNGEVVILKESRLSDYEYVAVYSVKSQYDNENVNWIKTLKYSFDQDDGWEVTAQETSVDSVEIDLIGLWKYEWYDEYITINMEHADNDDIKYDISIALRDDSILSANFRLQESSAENCSKEWTLNYNEQYNYWFFETTKGIITYESTGDVTLQYRFSFDENNEYVGMYVGSYHLVKQ